MLVETASALPLENVFYPTQRENSMSKDDFPKGAFAFIAVFFALLVTLWARAYLQLWGG